jgi:hypothetical protein
VRILHLSDVHVPVPLSAIPARDWLSKRAIGGLNYGFAGDSSALIGGGLMIAGMRSGPLRIDYFIESGYGVGKDASGGYQFVPIIGGIAYSVSKP